ncbi:MAG: hypothetical protein ACLU6Z_00680 [Odoribacter splanchnicus]
MTSGKGENHNDAGHKVLIVDAVRSPGLGKSRQPDRHAGHYDKTYTAN